MNNKTISNAGAIFVGALGVVAMGCGNGCLPRDAVDQAYIDLTTGWDVTDTKPLRLP